MRRLLVAAAVLFGALGSAIGSFAYFQPTGQGDGAGTVGTLAPVIITTATATPATALLPGGSADLSFRVSNPNHVAVQLTDVIAIGALTFSSDGCTLSNASVSFSDQAGLSIEIPADASNYLVEIPSALSMGVDSASSCQASSIGVPIRITVRRG